MTSSAPRARRALLPLLLLCAGPASAAVTARAPERPPAPARPRVDEAAMREAMGALSGGVAAPEAGEGRVASSFSYAHFLRARLAHHRGEHRLAADELRLALATEERGAFLRVRLAEELARLGDFARAERELRRALEAEPADYAAHVMLGRVLLEAGRAPRARTHLTRAVALRPREPEAYLVLAQLHLQAGRRDEAVRVAEQLGAAAPGEAEGYRRVGLALAEHGDGPRAERLLVRALERDPGDGELWAALARLQERAGRLADAGRSWERALEADPDRREALLAAGQLALRAGEVPRARAYFDRALGLARDPDLVVRVAFALLGVQQWAQAAEVLEAARAAGEEDPRVAYYAGLVREQLRQWGPAEAAYARVPETSALGPEALLRRGGCLSQLGQHARALALLDGARARRPDDADTLVAWARALERAGRAGEAEAALRAGVARRPDAPVVQALAATLLRAGRGPDALALLEGAARGAPRDEALRFALAAALERQGQGPRALEEMRALLALNPDHAAALNFVGYLLADQGSPADWPEAERLLDRALRLRPDSGAFLDSLGWLHFRRGDVPRALEALERAAQLEPGEPAILEHLGEALQAAGRPADAAAAWRRALDVLSGDPETAERPDQRAGLERKLKSLSSGAAGR